MYQQPHLFRPGITALLTLCAHSLFGGVVLDGSFGKSGALPGPNFMIQSSFGKQVGGNLFQSFSQFNLTSPQSATFTGPWNVQNILARVTSGSPSSIDGRISSDIQGANLFFMNPAGVLFGKDAQLDVKGSFAVTTANYLNLVGGGRFNANLGGGDVLTTAPVSAFGFLNSAPKGVSIVGNNYLDSNGALVASPLLNVAPGKSFSIVAGDITMNGGQIAGERSRVNLVSVKSAGEAKLDATNINSAIDVTQFTTMGTIDLRNSALIDVSGPGGGPIFIRGGNLYLFRGAKIVSDTVDTGNGGNVSVIVSSILIGAAGAVDPNFGEPVPTGIFADTEAFSSGNGGNIAVRAHDMRIMAGGRIFSGTVGEGNGGTVHVNVDSLLIDGGGVRGSTGISAGASVFDGHGGRVVVRARDLKIIAGGAISSSNDGFGDAGDVNVITDSLLIDAAGAVDFGPIPTGIFTDVAFRGVGNGGRITLQARDMRIMAGGAISSSTAGAGNGGNIRVHADSLLIDAAGAVDDFGDLIATGIFANTAILGNGGSIAVRARDLRIMAGGQISSSTFGDGDGGSVSVKADSLLIDGAGSDLFSTGILAVTQFDSSVLFFVEFNPGKGGEVAINANSLSLKNGATISAAALTGTGDFFVPADAFTTGAAGSVQLSLGTLSINSGSSISSANTGSGTAGSIFIGTTGSLNLRHGSSITAASILGDAGSIELISGGMIKLSSGSSITGSAGASGGNILITTPDLLYLIDSEISAVAGGSGGNFTINSQFIVLNNSVISTNAAPLLGGNQNLISDFLFSSDSLIIATGTITGAVPELDLGAQLITLPTSLLSVENQLQERCTALLQGDFSSFISIGRGGTEPAPEELQTTF